VEGQLKAYELYGHDLLSVGVDIYNPEAEAIGCRVRYFNDESIPAIEKHVLEEKTAFPRLKMPDPEHSGRLPLLLDAASRIKNKLSGEVPVNGTVVGPFTLAALLRGYENFVLDMVTDPSFAGELLDFTAEAGLAYGKAIIERGLGLSINESWISPPLLSPTLYREFAFPRQKFLIERLKEAGALSVGLISGGNTTAIADLLVQAGSSILMADWGTDLAFYKEKAEQARIILRGSIESRLLENGTREEIAVQARHVLGIGMTGGRFILGCGVLPFGADPEKVLFLKSIAVEHKYQQDTEGC
jgi:uroporphyrinogen decarboxylase